MAAMIDFWFSIGSTYTYLTVMRIDARCAEARVAVRYRPYDVRTVMLEQKNIPFANKPVKTAYMWRDMERRAAMYGLPINVPAPYPLADLARANRIALMAQDEGWLDSYLQTTYRLWFQDGLIAGEGENLDLSVAGSAKSVASVIAAASTEAMIDRLASETAECMALGVFGSPSFVVNGEVFWGDDRLDDAIAWAKHGTLANV